MPRTLTTLAAQLSRLEARREALIREIQTTVAAMTGTSVAERPARGVRRRRRGGRPKGFKVSAATKAKLRAAWKKRREAAEE